MCLLDEGDGATRYNVSKHVRIEGVLEKRSGRGHWQKRSARALRVPSCCWGINAHMGGVGAVTAARCP